MIEMFNHSASKILIEGILKLTIVLLSKYLLEKAVIKKLSVNLLSSKSINTYLYVSVKSDDKN